MFARYDWKIEKIVDDGVGFGALLTDLFKASGCTPHDLIIDKLEAYGFHVDVSKLIHDYNSHNTTHIFRGRIHFTVFRQDPY